MDRYQEFCLADPLFFDSPDKWNDTKNSWRQTGLPAPEGWLRSVMEPWVHLAPAGAQLPLQGWKAHVSACVDDAQRTLDAVWDYCVSRKIAFKFLPTKNALIVRNLKYTDRGGSGKFITLYPRDEAVLESMLNDLGAMLSGVRGPYILSDLRWESGPLYVRYGGFVLRECLGERGEVVPAIEDPAGRLVPDRRHPVFRPPEWITLPSFLSPQLASLGEDQPPADFPYLIERALHYSNGGGVYEAIDTRSGEQVVLKEARPYAGLDGYGVDAIARLRREHEFLRQLGDVEHVVRVIDYLVLGEHHFIVEEFVPGERLNRLMAQRSPLVNTDADAELVADYTTWALGLLDQVEATLAALHDRGITYGDLHPNNIVVQPDGQMRLIDFEMAYHRTDRPNAGMGAPGYVPPDGRAGPAADLYALACLRLALFLPVTPIIALDPDKAAHLAAIIAGRFPVPPGYAEQVSRGLDLPTRRTQRSPVRELVTGLERGEPDWAAIRRSLVQAILASATPERTDRLFPGDLYQFSKNGLGFGYGAAGVLHALAESGHGRYPEYEEWLLRAVREGRADRHTGFYDGLHGIAYALDRLGRPDDAERIVRRACRMPIEALPSDLFGGLAGVGLSLLHFAAERDDGELERLACQAAEVLAVRLPTLDGISLGEVGGPPADTGKGGLLRGPAGPALFLIRLFEHTGNERFLDLAERALAADVRHCVTVDRDHSVQLDEGWRVTPYLGSGSAGVGVVLREYLRHRPDERLLGILDGIRKAASAEFIMQPGLFNGRAGLIGLLSAAPADDRLAKVIGGHLRRLSWHALDYRGHLSFPGEQLLRLSMDLGSGNAGVLLALGAALEQAELLPFLKPRNSRAPSVKPASEAKTAEAKTAEAKPAISHPTTR